MYSAYFGAPWNRWTDATPFFAGFNSVYTSTGNHWEGDILPGMCKADNALTNWGTVDLSKFDETKLGYRWHNDAWFDNDRAGLARSIIWSPSNANTFFSEGTPTPVIVDGGRTIPAGRKGMGRDYFGYHEDRTQASSYSKRWNKYRITPHQKGGTYDGFKLHERPEFQPVSGDGRYFGGVGGVDNWGGTSYNTWGPGMTVSPAVWDLKWSGIQHPFRVSPSVEEDSDTFFNATSIENQTSYIGGAPNVRVLIGDNGGTFKYSDGTAVSGTGYNAEDPRAMGGTPRNYDWAIGGNQIQCNHWDRTLKIQDLENHVNNGVHAGSSQWHANTTYHFQYMYDEAKINPPMYKYWVLRIPAGLDAYNGESLL